MNIQKNNKSATDAKTLSEKFQFSNTTSYAKLVATEKILRTGGFNVRLVSDDQLVIEHKCKNGHLLKLDVTTKERLASFQICMPLDFINESKEILSILNQLNDYSRENDHSELWVMGYKGKVYLFNVLLDDGHFDMMNDVVTYLVSDMFEFAEYGLERLSEALQSDYVPATNECTEMYR